MLRIATLATLSLLTAQAQAYDAVTERLRLTKSLRCEFTDSSLTEFKDGHRSIRQTGDKGAVVFDNIDVQHGTARIIAQQAGDVSVHWTGDGYWFLERAPFGNLIVTTVFAKYAEGTQRFIVIESRHWAMDQFASGEQASGSCEALN